MNNNNNNAYLDILIPYLDDDVLNPFSKITFSKQDDIFGLQ